MQGGWVKVSRDVFAHSAFVGDPYSRREAWLWLIAHAAWHDTKHRFGNEMLQVKRGEIIVSLRYLSTAWGWKSDKKVRNFLDFLEREKMIGRKMDARKTHLSICNYKAFQDGTEEMDARKTHERRSKEEREEIKKGDAPTNFDLVKGKGKGKVGLSEMALRVSERISEMREAG